MTVQVVSHVETDADATAAALESFWPGIVLGASDGPVLFRLNGWETGLGLSYIEVALSGRHVSADVEGTSGLMVTELEAFDGALTESGAPVDDSQPYVTRAGLRSQYSSARTRTLAVQESVFETYLSQYADGPPRGGFRFTGTAPVTEEHGAAWRSLTAHVGSAVRAGLGDDPLIGPALTQTVIAFCVTCFPNNQARAASERSSSTATVRRAKTFMDEHAAEPITVADVAAAARLSIRGLQGAFRSQVGMTPMAYLRRVRLSSARASLLAGDPADDTRVAAIARAAGFVHLSRFAAAYRDEYGENPSDTLRR